MFLNTLIVIQVLNILTTKAIINKNWNKTLTKAAGTLYLNSERPLWILQDIKDEKVYVKKPIKEKVKYVPSYDPSIYTKGHYTKQPLHEDSNRISDRLHKKRSTYDKRKYKGLPLPQNYIPVKKPPSRPDALTPSRRYKNSKFLGNLPVFDAVPGDEAYTKSAPIFIYTGNKGRMLLNTMLSKRKYPMQEPVPGQLLYPPQTLVFKPKALVDNLQQKFNVTMTPFYPYEAIDYGRQEQLITTVPSATTSSSSSLFKPTEKKKTAKQYTAFYSPEEVLSQPLTRPYHYHHSREETIDFPPTLRKPHMENHRLNNIRVQESPPTTTPLPHKKFQVNYNDGEDKFQIIYEDDTANLERPLNVQTTTLATVPYESYTYDKNYYAFPIYTMAKLLEKNDSAQHMEEMRMNDEKNVTVERQQIEKYIDTALKEENDSLLNKSIEDTWFILNSRYKGPLKTNANNLHSSKYIQTPPVKIPNDLDLMMEYPKEEDRTKIPLQAHSRSLYGENINIIL